MAIARNRAGTGVVGIFTPQLLLVIAGLLVGVSILLGRPFSRPINGVAGIAWIASAVWMLAQLRTESRRLAIGLVAFAGALVMAAMVRPGSYVEAIVGFAIAGAAVALVAREHTLKWALLAPAIYFPLHIVIALARVVASGGARAVRTDPPPTDAFVPFSMIVAAALAGYLVSMLTAKREEERPR